MDVAGFPLGIQRLRWRVPSLMRWVPSLLWGGRVASLLHRRVPSLLRRVPSLLLHRWVPSLLRRGWVASGRRRGRVASLLRRGRGVLRRGVLRRGVGGGVAGHGRLVRLDACRDTRREARRTGHGGGGGSVNTRRQLVAAVAGAVRCDPRGGSVFLAHKERAERERERERARADKRERYACVRALWGGKQGERQPESELSEYNRGLIGYNRGWLGVADSFHG